MGKAVALRDCHLYKTKKCPRYQYHPGHLERGHQQEPTNTGSAPKTTCDVLRFISGNQMGLKLITTLQFLYILINIVVVSMLLFSLI